MKRAFEKKLIAAYEQMYKLTHDACVAKCMIPFSCCSPEYCLMNIEWAKDKYGITLEPTGNPKLPLLGENGCVAAPYLRPLCTVHVCERMYMTDVAFHKAYFKLRDKIDSLEYEREFG